MKEIEQELHRYLELVVKQSEMIIPPLVNIDGIELTRQELKSIKYINQQPKCMMRDIANYLLLDPSSVTWIINKLIKKRIAHRHRSKDDRRIVVIELSELGKKIVQKYQEMVGTDEASLYSVLSDQEQEILLLLLKKIVHTI